MITLKKLQIYFTPNKKPRGEFLNEKAIKLNKILFNSGLTNEEISLLIITLREDGKHELKQRRNMLENEITKTIIAENKL